MRNMLTVMRIIADEELYMISDPEKQTEDVLDFSNFRAFFVGSGYSFAKFDQIRLVLAQFIPLFLDTINKKVFRVPIRDKKQMIKWTMEDLENFKSGSIEDQYNNMLEEVFEDSIDQVQMAEDAESHKS